MFRSSRLALSSPCFRPWPGPTPAGKTCSLQNGPGPGRAARSSGPRRPLGHPGGEERAHHDPALRRDGGVVAQARGRLLEPRDAFARPEPRRPRPLARGGVQGAGLHPGEPARDGQAHSVRPGGHPRRRDRRQGRGHDAAARPLGGRVEARLAGPRELPLRPHLQRGRPRALLGLHPDQPAGTEGSGLAHHRAQPEPEPRLREARRPARRGSWCGRSPPGRWTSTTTCTSPTTPTTNTT